MGALAADFAYWKDQAILGQEQQMLDNANAMANYQAHQQRLREHERKDAQTPKPNGGARGSGKCPPTNPGGGGKKSPVGNAVAALGDDGPNRGNLNKIK